MDFYTTEVNTENFINEVIDKSAEKHVLVFFHATWCPHCQDLSPRLEKLSSDYDLILAKVDVDQNPKLVEAYGVQSFPDVKLISNGEVTDSFLGALPDPLIINFFFQNQLQPNDLLLGGDENETLFGGPEKDKLDGGLGNDELFGFNSNDQLYGNSGNDTLRGGFGDDYLWGGTGNDRLFGGTEDDYIWGGEGDDLLKGNVGYDILTGNDGMDTFVLTPGEGVDIITDFEVDFDTLEFHGGITPEQLSINQIDTNTVIELTDETLAILININASEIMAASDFV